MLAIKKHLSLILLMLPFSITPIFAQNVAGNAIFVLGKVNVMNSYGEEHRLKKGGELNAGDVIITSERGQAQIKMSDGTLLAIRPNSRFRIDEYQFKHDKENDKSFYSLMKGGFRSITGKIGKEKKSAYGVKTVVGTIGIRGTDYSARLCDANCTDAEDGLYVSVMDGGVVLSNESNEIDIAPGEYGFMQDSFSEPVYLESAPGDLLFAQSTTPNEEQNEDVAVTSENDNTVEANSDSTTQDVAVSISTTQGYDLFTDVESFSIESVDSGIALPSSGNALYQVVSSTVPTDGVNNGTLNEINTSLNVDFVTSSATAAITAEINSESWTSNSSSEMPINSDGSFNGDLFVNITPTGLGASRTGTGSLDGNLNGTAEPSIGAPNDANFNYRLTDNSITVTGSVDLTVSNTTP